MAKPAMTFEAASERTGVDPYDVGVALQAWHGGQWTAAYAAQCVLTTGAWPDRETLDGARSEVARVLYRMRATRPKALKREAAQLVADIEALLALYPHEAELLYYIGGGHGNTGTDSTGVGNHGTHNRSHAAGHGQARCGGVAERHDVVPRLRRP